MRLNGEMAYGEEEEERKEKEVNTAVYSIGGGGFVQPPKLVVGYALTSKKKKSFLQPKFIGLARNKGIFFVAIDLNKPLLEQGPFDIILHKLSGKQWSEIVEVRELQILLSTCMLCNNLAFLDFDTPFTALVLALLMNHDEIVEISPSRIQTRPQSVEFNLNNEERWKGFLLDSISTNRECTALSVSDLLALFLFVVVVFLLFFGSVDYRHKHPEVTILDPPDAIQHLHNRESMLQHVSNLNLSDCNGMVGVPRQLVITKDKDPSSIPYEVTKAGIRLPLVAKPLVVDGSAKSHELFLAYDEFSLSELEPPLVLQEFVNHGGLLFKIYIIGDAIKVVRRFSLPNISERERSKVAGVFRFPRVSCAAASADNAALDPSIAELPPRPLLERLIRELRNRLVATKMPGYGKMPDYEHVFTEFLLSQVQSKFKKITG
ncbi:inositol-tetrakisphosphate 1-kinase 3-like isoform X1 [Senna tora]|uniref:Inositol-tetrakisphosphate 1-kinase 3-like isoform X1 n=1 Tax=Senna tora TaxID=362788 RepID=A0A834X9D2_9FABA|nr:inositol-tetrakisphosphate 1-kinase 3-like isoform X1 [Senna tora]